ncbi:VWA domain-containing protein [Salinibacterium sp. SWN1162]|uniref:VWA domain-containing protein n=1 Tax=Salinibacterium sp. SWN1162 TaxID=2792053 RepID=UPI0018CCD8AF|nr:VWA domain-containing protein [Salinibacterium sp. SWN1162]MBH0010099.1 substrate-binding domain-containing protein [Salinibacterium sp. SWN1162]
MTTRRHRHRKTFWQRWKKRWWLVPIALVSIASLALAGIQFGAIGWITNAVTPFAGGCSDTRPVVIAADPSIAPTLTAVAADFDAAEGNCTSTEVRSLLSADTAALFASGASGDLDAWVPDSAAWLDRVESMASSLGRTAPELEITDYVASTPVVLATSAAQVSTLGDEPLSWGSLLSGTVATLLPDPEASTASLAGLAQLKSVSSAEDPRQFAGAMLAIGKTIPQSTEEAFELAADAAVPTVVITTEREVAAYNTASPSSPVVALYPSDGTVELTYPFVEIVGAGSDADAAGAAGTDASSAVAADSAETDDSSKLLTAFAAATRSSVELLAGEGFRDADGGGALRVTGVPEVATEAKPTADAAVQIEILRSWSVLTLRSRLLVVIDVSGSMLDPANNGLRRIDVFQLAAGEALSKFSGEAELGVWAFSQNRIGTQDWEPLSPIEPLSDPAHVAQINGVVASLPDQIYGYTGLYDTILAAVKHVKEDYDPSKINSVLLITDGYNEDDDGISLDALLKSLKELEDPTQPVPVILIGFGPDTDLESMTEIAQSTGGAAYSATVPEDLGKVLVDALSQRSCRPNCT